MARKKPPEYSNTPILIIWELFLSALDMKKADSNENSIKFYADAWTRQWCDRNLKTAKLRNTNLSELIRQAIKKNDNYPHNVAELLDRLMKTYNPKNEETFDLSVLTEEEFVELMDVGEILQENFKKWVLYKGPWKNAPRDEKFFTHHMIDKYFKAETCETLCHNVTNHKEENS